MPRPVRFGVITLPHAPWPEMVAWWRRIEAWGFDSVWDCDHFVNPYQTEQDWFEGWTLLAALATQTSRIRIGTLVTAIPFHNPAFLARQCVTVDHIANGRLEIGLGAGSLHDPSYSMAGVENHPARERVARYREAVEIIDQLLREGESSYQGKYYSTQGALLRPAPVQRPRPPFTLAAQGPTAMKIAARYADTWNVYSSRGLTLEQAVAEARERNASMDRLCGEIGRDPAAIRRSLLIFGAQEHNPFTSVAAFEEFVQRFHAAGIDEFIMYYPPDRFYGAEATSAAFERIATEALPRLRALDGASA